MQGWGQFVLVFKLEQNSPSRVYRICTNGQEVTMFKWKCQLRFYCSYFVKSMGLKEEEISEANVAL